MAVQEYKKRGGGYEDDGPDQDETDLHDWTEEDWGTKSGEESAESGERYLPKKVRMPLTEDEYARGKGPVAALENKRKDELYEMAKEHDNEGRSDMSKEELVSALKKD